MTKIDVSNYGLCLAVAATLMVASGSPAQTLTTLVTLDGTNQGNGPIMSLMQGFNGKLYGTTSGTQGNGGAGTVFNMTPSGALTTLYNFCAKISCTDGSFPEAGLVQHTNGHFYGTTQGGGTGCFGNAGCGTVFEVTPQGVTSILYSFCTMMGCPDGAYPVASLTEGTDGNLYGTTWLGGNNNCSGFPPGCGTIFKLTTEGVLTTLYEFCSEGYPQCLDGAAPLAGLIQATNGNFYGVTAGGGAYGKGTIFKITPRGKLTTLYSFCSQTNCADGAIPNGPLVEDTHSNFYGTTVSGGLVACDAPPSGCGTVFKITMSGELTVLHAFNGNDGSFPYSGVLYASDGNFYGETGRGGIPGCDYDLGCGTVFRVTPTGSITTLYSFCAKANCSDGFEPYGLAQDTSGAFYGATYKGGNKLCLNNEGCGTIFSLSAGLSPFVSSVPSAGKVGVEVGIFGSGLTGATSVTFNGTPAQFRVRSASLILTRVPTDATTGKIAVTLPGQTLLTNVPFYVIP